MARVAARRDPPFPFIALRGQPLVLTRQLVASRWSTEKYFSAVIRNGGPDLWGTGTEGEVEAALSGG